MLVVLLKKTDYNTRVAEIDATLSNLDGKIAKNKNELIKDILEGTTFGTLLFSSFQAYLIF